MGRQTMTDGNLEKARNRLFASLRHEIVDGRVLKAMERVPREDFVPDSQRHVAYENIPLPIGMGQSISQPLIIAMMTEALELGKRDKVLEVGTGTGYQTAVLAQLAGRVITVERLAPLAEAAENRLKALGYTNVEVRLAGDKLGWSEEAPYGGIVVTAGGPRIAPELIEQLADRGRLVMPVGARYEQDLIKVVKHGKGIRTINLGGCRFVPLIGPGAWSDLEAGFPAVWA